MLGAVWRGNPPPGTGGAPRAGRGPAHGAALQGAAGPSASRRPVAACPGHPARVSGGWDTAAVAADGAGRRAGLSRAGQAAALALARRLGLPTATPTVLSSRGNLLLHFAPEPVVARVATLTAWSRRD